MSHAGPPVGPATVTVIALCACGVVNRRAPLVLPAGASFCGGVTTGHGSTGVGGAVVTGVGVNGDLVDAVIEEAVDVIGCRDRR